jgi:hypothetical protein
LYSTWSSGSARQLDQTRQREQRMLVEPVPDEERLAIEALLKSLRVDLQERRARVR